MKKATKTGLFFLMMVIFYFVIGLGISSVIPEKYYTVNVSYILGQMTIIIPALAYVLITKGRIFKELPFRKIKIENALILIIFAYVCLPIVGFLNSVTMLFSTNHVASTVGGLTENPFIINVLMIALLPAFMEEFVFRGIIFNGFRKSGIFAAIIMSGMCFGMFHMNINQFVYAFLMGCVFALVNEASGSILGSMIMHFMFNFNTVISIQMLKLLPLLNKVAGNSSGKVNTPEINTDLSAMTVQQKVIMIAVYGVLAVGATVLNVFIFKWYAKRTGRSEHIKEIFANKSAGLKNSENGRTVTIPLILAYIVCMVTMVLIN